MMTSFDVKEYDEYLKNSGMTNEEKLEFLRTLVSLIDISIDQYFDERLGNIDGI